MLFKKEKTDVISSSSVARPKNIVVGFYSSIKKKDLESYIYGRAKDAMSVSNCHYNIMKYRDGFIWELHEGGEGKGILSSVLSLLETKDTVIVALDDRFIRLSNKSNGSIACYLVNEDDKPTETEGVLFDDKMEPVVTSGYSFFNFAKWTLVASVLSVSFSFSFKYVVYDKEEEIITPQQKAELPMNKIMDIKKALDEKGAYVSSLMYKNKKWELIKVKEIQPQIEPQKETNQVGLDKVMSEMEKKLNSEKGVGK